MRTIWGLFDSYAQVQALVRELQRQGFDQDDMNIIVQEAVARREVSQDDVAALAANRASGEPRLIDLNSLLVGHQAMRVSDVGPLVTAGEMATLIGKSAVQANRVPEQVSGNTISGLQGALIDFGVSEEEARRYAEGIKQGDILLAIRVDDEQASELVTLMHNPPVPSAPPSSDATLS